METQQTVVRFASGVTGGTAIAGTCVSLLMPPVGVAMFTVGATGYCATQATDAVMNINNDCRLEPLLSLQYTDQIEQFMNEYNINEIDIAELRRLRTNTCTYFELGKELSQATLYLCLFFKVPTYFNNH